MTMTPGRSLLLTMGLILLAGCRTDKPNLAPAKGPEQFVSPPVADRYERVGFPPEALDVDKSAPLRAIINDAPRFGPPNAIITNGVR